MESKLNFSPRIFKTSMIGAECYSCDLTRLPEKIQKEKLPTQNVLCPGELGPLWSPLLRVRHENLSLLWTAPGWGFGGTGTVWPNILSLNLWHRRCSEFGVCQTKWALIAEEEYPFQESDRRYLSHKKNFTLFLSRYFKSRLSSPVSLVINPGYLLSCSFTHIDRVPLVGRHHARCRSGKWNECFLRPGSSVSSVDKLHTKQGIIQTSIALNYG